VDIFILDIAEVVEPLEVVLVISGVAKVVLDVDDQERAKTFWTETMGFAVVQDTPYGEERWLEVQAPDDGVILVLGRSSTGPGDREAVSERLPTSNVMFRCDDLPGTYEQLSARGVAFPQPPVEQSFGWWCMFADTEGNRFALQPAGQ
jgi:predicted enzyme related to lactoylglutathione lyase